MPNIPNRVILTVPRPLPSPDKLTHGGETMLRCCRTSLAMLLLASNVVIAQTAQTTSTPQKPLSKSALRQQDRQECIKQAVQQNIAKRNRAAPVRKCMADRQVLRKASQKKGST